MATTTEQTTLMGALACLDVDLERELQQFQQERATWAPGFLVSLLGSKPTPPPESAWTFPPAASADESLAAAEVVTESAQPLAVPDVPDLEATVILEPGEATVALVPPADPSGGAEPAEFPGALALTDAGEDETTDKMMALLKGELPDGQNEPDEPDEPDKPVETEVALGLGEQRPSWSERLHRVFARRHVEDPAGALAVAEEAVTDPWLETFPAPQQRTMVHRGLQHPVLGFAIGLTVATLGTLAGLYLLNPKRPSQTVAPQLSVPAPPPETAVVPPPQTAPVPNLARKELPDLSAIPTASPQASPAARATPGLYYVVMDYQNEQSLIEAQKVVPEAFVWQFPAGVKVQLAAFELRDQAEQFVADLKTKGVNARVYP
ncbi:MAG: hypothetical protein Q6J33_03785 [Gloeomargarita sp. DG_2_bins_126]